MGVLSCGIFSYNMGEPSQNPVFNLALNLVALLGLIFMPLAFVSLLAEPISCHAKNSQKKFQCTSGQKAVQFTRELQNNRGWNISCNSALEE